VSAIPEILLNHVPVYLLTYAFEFWVSEGRPEIVTFREPEYPTIRYFSVPVTIALQFAENVEELSTFSR
jgi:hypothetical protein